MNLTITDSARDQIKKVMGESDLKKPALRIIFSGLG